MSGVESGGTRRTWMTTAITALAVGFGTAVGQYAGLMLAIPATLTAVIWWLARKLLPASRQLIVAVLAINAGHASWLAIGLVVRGQFAPVALDLVVYCITLVWLVVRPGVWPLSVQGVYQVAALVVNGVALASAADGSIVPRALVIHVLWCVLSLVAIGRLWVRIRQRKGTTA